MHRARFGRGGDDLFEIMSVDLDHVPIERRIFFGERLKRHYFFGDPVDLDAIAIDDDREVAQSILSREHHRLPRVAFLMLAIGGYAVNMIFLFIKLGSERDAGGLAGHAAPVPDLWSADAPAVFDGDWLAHAGLPLPPLRAESVAVFHIAGGDRAAVPALAAFPFSS